MSDVPERARARGLTEVLRLVPSDDLAVGDEIVQPGLLQVYGTDKDGYATLRADAGSRYRILSHDGVTTTAESLSCDGIPVEPQIISQPTPQNAQVLKVIKVEQ